MQVTFEKFGELFEWLQVKEDAEMEEFGLELKKDAPEEMKPLLEELKQLVRKGVPK